MPRGRPRKNPEDVLMRSAELIGWALGGIEREIVDTRNKLASLTAQATQLRKRMGSRVKSATGSSPASAMPAADANETGEPQSRRGRRRKRTMSPEARKRISEMMKKRWAERKRAK